MVYPGMPYQVQMPAGLLYNNMQPAGALNNTPIVKQKIQFVNPFLFTNDPDILLDLLN